MRQGEGRDELIEGHRVFVRKIVHKTIAMMHLPQENFDEYESAAFLGLVEAAERYDPAAGVTFRSFAYLRIRGSIIDYIRDHSELTGAAYRYARAIKALENIEEEALREVATAERSTREEALQKIFKFAATGALAYRLSSLESEPAIELIPDENQKNPEEFHEFKEDISLMKECVALLPEKERFIVEKYYFEGRSFVELTHLRPELTKSWISRLHARALTRLGQMMEERHCEAA